MFFLGFNYSNDYVLTNYLLKFYRMNNSFISDNFIGFNKIQIFCDNCIRKTQSFVYNCNFNNTSRYEYNYFFHMNFNLNEINNYYKKKISMQNKGTFFKIFNKSQINDDNNQSINLDNCFNYTFKETNKKIYKEFCNFCFTNSQKIKNNSIYSLPDILTIVLSNYEDCNFIINNELDLSQYVMNNEKKIYYIIGILCQISYNGQFICYCINPNNGYWYSYTNEKVIRVEKIDINAIPLILMYQTINTISFEYNHIRIDDMDKVLINVKCNKFPNPKKIFFNKNILIKKAIKQIVSIMDIKETKCRLVINGDRANENDNLSKYLDIYNNAILMIDK